MKDWKGGFRRHRSDFFLDNILEEVGPTFKVESYLGDWERLLLRG